jgi:hypothetical protein
VGQSAPGHHIFLIFQVLRVDAYGRHLSIAVWGRKGDANSLRATYTRAAFLAHCSLANLKRFAVDLA